MTEEQRKLLEVAADLATIATLLLLIAEKLGGKRKPRKRTAGKHKRKRGGRRGR